MGVSPAAIRKYYWDQYYKVILAFILLLVLLVGFFIFSYSRSVTGATIEHRAIVIEANVIHSYGPQGQNVKARLNNGEVVYLVFWGTSVNIGDDIVVIEQLRRGGATSYYRFKSAL